MYVHLLILNQLHEHLALLNRYGIPFQIHQFNRMHFTNGFLFHFDIVYDAWPIQCMTLWIFMFWEQLRWLCSCFGMFFNVSSKILLATIFFSLSFRLTFNKHTTKIGCKVRSSIFSICINICKYLDGYAYIYEYIYIIKHSLIYMA